MNHLSKEQIHELTLNYHTVSDFKKQEYKLYRRAVNKGWWAEVSKHLARREKPVFTIDDIMKISLQYDKLYDFIKNQHRYYQYARRKGWQTEVTKHMIQNRKWFGTVQEMNELTEVAKNYNTRDCFQRNHPNLYYAANKFGWLNIVCSHMSYQPEKNPYKKRNENTRHIL